ncbi:MAG: right-handed parallel beta-helix repeat-containing protein [Lachnospiraceae bacterium]|nr:right-handed parallel beta-helix repeat-containing protein [Lachnospiraceae bacterium]
MKKMKAFRKRWIAFTLSFLVTFLSIYSLNVNAEGTDVLGENDVVIETSESDLITYDDVILEDTEDVIDDESIVDVEDVIDEADVIENVEDIDEESFEEDADVVETDDILTEDAASDENESDIKADLEESEDIITEEPVEIIEEPEEEVFEINPMNGGYVYNVTSYGANGNDEGDDWEAIKNALAEAKTATTDIEVRIPAGTYYISQQLPIYSNTTLVVDSNATIIRTNHSDLTGMIVGCHTDGNDHGGYTRISNVEIKGGTWNANSSAYFLTGAFVFQHASDIYIHDLTIKGCTDHVINASASKNVTIENVTFSDCPQYKGTSSEFWGDHSAGDSERYKFNETIHLDYAGNNEKGATPLDGTVCNNINITGCTFNGVCAGVGTHHESSQYRAQNVTVSGCTFSNLTNGSAINAYSFDNFAVKNCQMNSCLIGVLSVDSNGEVSGNTISSVSSATSNYGVLHLERSQINVKSNTIKNAPKALIYIYEGSNTIDSNVLNSAKEDAIRVDGNATLDIKNNSDISGFTRYGIFVKGNTSKINISSNKFSGTCQMGMFIENCSNTGNTISYNTVSCGSDCNITVQNIKGTISHNTLSGCTNGIGLYIVNSSVTASENEIKNAKNGIYTTGGSPTVNKNTISGSGSDGIRIDSASTATVSNNTISNTKRYTIFVSKTTGATTISKNTISGTNEEVGIFTENCTGSVKIDGNTISTGSFAGIMATKCSGTISNNKVTGLSGDGLQTLGDSSTAAKFNIENNTFKTSSSSNYDIRLNSYSKDCVLKDNSLGSRGINAASGVTYTLTSASNFTGIKKDANGNLRYYKNGLEDNSVNGLTSYDGTWYYLKNGVVDTSATTLVYFSGSWYYVQKGVLVWGVNTLVQYNGTWYYVKNSTVDFNYTGIFTYGGTDYYIQKGVIKWGVDGLANAGNNNWYYLKNSAVQKNATTLVSYGGTWYYVKNGKLDWNYTGIFTYGGTDYYVQKGVLKWGVNGLTSVGGTWYYLKNSAVQKGYTGLVQLGNSWYYVQKGVLKWGENTLVQYNGTWYYVKNSTVDFTFTGVFEYGGTDYYIQKGAIKWGVNGLTNVGGTWYYLKNSAVVKGYTGLVEHNNTLYYVQKGVLKWGYYGTVTYNGKKYNVKNSTASK